MMRARTSPASAVLFGGVFCLGAGLGVWCWASLNLPFENPGHVVSPLTAAGANPADDLLGFSCLLILPIVLLGSIYRFRGTLLAKACFEGRTSSLRDDSGKQGPAVRGVARVILLAAVAGTAALHLPTDIADGPLDTFHEGESLGPAALCERGMLPYRDLFVPHGPFQDPLRSVAAFRLFGRAISSQRVVQSALKVVQFILIAAFVGQVFRRQLGVSLCVLLAFLGPFFLEHELGPWLMATQRDLTLFAFLVATVWAGRRLERRGLTRRGALAAGFVPAFLAFASFGYSVDRGIFLSAACVVLSGLLWFACPGKNGIRRAYVGGALLGLGAAAALLGIILRSAVVPFVEVVFLQMPKYWEELVGLEYPIGSGPFLLAAALVAFNAYWLCFLFLRLLNAEGGGWGSSLRRLVREYLPEVALLVCSVFVFKSALGRSDWGHVAIGVAPSYLLLLVLSSRYGGRAPAKVRWGMSCSALILAAPLMLTCLSTLRGNPRYLLVRNFPVGVADDEYVPASYREAAEFLEKNLSPEETFYTLTSEGIWYYLVDRPSPSRFAIVYYAATEEFQKELVDNIASHSVKYIIVSNASWYNNMDGFSVAERVPLVVSYIRQNYEPWVKIHDNIVWVRRSS
jgi:hypothetical protein